MTMNALDAAGELPEEASGHPAWIEVATPDPAATKAFYAGLFGWRFRVHSRGDALAEVGEIPVAGVHASQGPGHWHLYLTVGSIVNTADRVLQLGGHVLEQPHAVPGHGQLLVVQDPSGAEIGFCEPEPGWELGAGFPGAFTWAELNTWDGAEADSFYASLFGFDQQQVGDGIDVDYTLWTMAGVHMLGRLRMGAEFPPDSKPHWMVSFEVPAELGVDGCIARAVQLGGRVSVPPYNGPEGRAAVLQDVTGAVFTVLDRSLAVPVVPEEVIGARVDDPYDD